MCTAAPEDGIVGRVVQRKDAFMAQPVSEHSNTDERVKATRIGFSLDWWSVFVAVALALLVLAGLLPVIPW